MRNKIKNKIYIGGLFLIPIFILAFCFFNITQADDSTVLTAEEQKKIEKKNDELQLLNEKAATYEKMLLLKQKQKSLLGAQIGDLNEEINGIKNEIKSNADKIEELNSRINTLQQDVIKNENLIQVQKKILANILRVYQENDDDAMAKMLLNIENFSTMAVKSDHLSQACDKIVEITTNLKSIQSQIKNSQDEILNNKSKLVEARNELEEENARLSSTKNQKNTLLIQTQGDEANYQAKLNKIEKQKQELLGDIDELYNANFAEISQFASGLEKPSSGLASTSWYYSQKDPRWKDKTIGSSNSIMSTYGCGISAVSMVFTYYGEKINPGELCKKPVFDWDIISWPNSKQVISGGKISLIKNTEHKGVNWSEIDSEIKKGNPVIVFVSAVGRKGHYVVIHHKADNGKYVVHDPYWGANIYLDSSIELLSKLYKVSISKKAINQMIIYK